MPIDFSDLVDDSAAATTPSRLDFSDLVDDQPPAPNKAELARQAYETRRRRRGGLINEVRPYVASDNEDQGDGRFKVNGREYGATKPATGETVLDRPATPEQLAEARAAETPEQRSARLNWESLSPQGQAKAIEAATGRRDTRRVTNQSTGSKVGGAIRDTADAVLGKNSGASRAVQGAVSGVAALGTAGTGLAAMAADYLGLDDSGDFLRASARQGTDLGDSATAAGGTYADKLITNVSSSIVQMAPMLGLGLAGAGEKAVFGELFAQTWGQEYAESRNMGYGRDESALRGALFGAAEVLGERFGFKEQMTVLKAALRRDIPTGELGKTIAAQIVKQVPGEELTTLAQFLADKYGPAARNPQATLGDYLQQAADTAVQTVAQAAVLGAPAGGRQAARRADQAVDVSAGFVSPQVLEASRRGELGSLAPETAPVLTEVAEAAAGGLVPGGSRPGADGLAAAVAATRPAAGAPTMPAPQPTAVAQAVAEATAPTPGRSLLDAMGVTPVAMPARTRVATAVDDVVRGQPAAPVASLFDDLLDRAATPPDGQVVSELIGETLAQGRDGRQPTQVAEAAQLVLQGDVPSATLDSVLGRAAADVAPVAAMPTEAAQGVAWVDDAASQRVDTGPKPPLGEWPKGDTFTDANGVVWGKDGGETPLAEGWARFGPETGTLGIPRANMPQVQAEHRGAMVNYLNARDVSHERVTVDPGTLKPSQAEYSPEKVEKAGGTAGDRSILISADGHVLDGHHQWMAAKQRGEPVQAIRLNAPAEQLLPLMLDFPSATVDTASATATITNDETAAVPAAPAPGAPAVEASMPAGPAAAGSVSSGYRRLVQDRLTAWAQRHNVPAAQLPRVGDPDAEADATVAAIDAAIGGLLGPDHRVIAFADGRRSAPNGFAQGGVALVNVASNEQGVAHTALHEIKHVVEQIARADEAAGRKDTPAQRFVAQIDGLFDDMTEAGKRAYVERYLLKDELKGLDSRARAARVRQALTSAQLRSEMTADFLGNRAEDREFLGRLAEADPRGFKAFVGKWLDLLDGMLERLRGAARRNALEARRVDQYMKNLGRAKRVALQALVEYRRATAGEPAPVDIGPAPDTLLQAVARMGGINRDELASEFGLRPEEERRELELAIYAELGGEGYLSMQGEMHRAQALDAERAQEPEDDDPPFDANDPRWRREAEELALEDVPFSRRQDDEVTAALQRKIDGDFDAAVAEYSALPDSMGGKVLNTDIARELSPDYLADRTRSAAVHEPSSAFVKRLYAQRLKELNPGDDVVFTSGGTGAGKTTAIAALPAVSRAAEDAAIIYDTNMNTLGSAVKKIEQALEAGANVRIVHVQRDPVEALTLGALTRAMNQAKKFGTGRTVPLAEHLRTHRGAAEVIQQLAERYKDDARVAVTIIDNTHGKGGARIADLGFIRGFDYNQTERKLHEALEQERDAGRISGDVYRATKGTAVPAAGAAVRAGDGLEPERQRDGAGQGGPAAGTSEGQGQRVAQAAEAAQILDAAGVLGKERIDVLKDVKAGAISLDELRAAYPAQSDTPPTTPPAEAAGDEPAFSMPQGATWDSPGESRLANAIYELQDRQVDLRHVARAIRESGNSLTDRTDAYLREELYHGRVAARTQQFAKKELQPLFTAMKAAGVTMPELEEFLHARHAKERNAEMMARNPGVPNNDALSGMSDADAAAILAKATPVMRQLAGRVDAIIDGTRDLMELSGLEEAQKMAAVRSKYANYVPLHRDEVDPGKTRPAQGQGFSVKGSNVKRATGSDAKVTNILAHIVMEREATITRAEKNLVATAVYAMAVQNPNSDFWQVDKPPKVKKVDDRREIPDPVTGQMVPNPDYNTVYSIVDPAYKNRDEVLIAKINGEDRAVVFNVRDERAMRMVRSLKNLDLEPMNMALNAVGKATRWLAAVNTQYNPVFTVVNGVRDIQGALVNLDSTPLRGQQKRVLGNAYAALRGIWRAERDPAARGVWEDRWREYQQRGGQTGWRASFEGAEDRAEALVKEIKALDRKLPARAVHGLLDLLSTANDSVENAIRLSAYAAARGMGISQDRAASIGKNLTVNFNRKGQAGQKLGALYAFFNAAMQGHARLAQALTGPTGKRIVAGGVMLGVMQALMLAGMDDDDREAIPEFVLEKSLVIPLPGHKFVQIPLPLGLHLLPNIGRHLAEMAINAGTGRRVEFGKHMVSAISAVAGAFNPFGGGGSLAESITPTVVDPIVQIATNKDFTGRPIYVERPINDPARPGAEMKRDSTNSAWGLAASVVNRLTGGDAYARNTDLGDWASPQPEILRHIAETIGGGVWRETERIVDAVIAGIDPKAEADPARLPFVSRFFGDLDNDHAPTTAYMQNLAELSALKRKIEGMSADGNGAGVERLVERRRETALVDAADDMRSQLRQLRETRRELHVAGADTDQIKAVEHEMATLMREFNRAVRKAKQGELE